MEDEVLEVKKCWGKVCRVDSRMHRDRARADWYWETKRILKRGSQDPFYYKEGNHSAHKHYLKQREE